MHVLETTATTESGWIGAIFQPGRALIAAPARASTTAGARSFFSKCVCEIAVLHHVCINVFCCDMYDYRISVSVQESHVFTVGLLKVIIIEIIHEMLGQIKYGHAHINRFV